MDTCTSQNSLIGSIPKIKFFICRENVVETMLSISQSLCIFSQQDFNHTPPHTYIHVTDLTFCQRTLKHTLFEIVYQEKKEPQNKSMPVF